MSRPLHLTLPAESVNLPAKSVADTLNRFVTPEEFGAIFRRKDRKTIRREFHWAHAQKPPAAIQVGRCWFLHLGRYTEAKGRTQRTSN